MSFKNQVIETTKEIPRGRVATYGQIAALCGSPRAAISVGQILHNYLDEQGDIPWQRVINSKGYISTTCLEHPAELQASLLKNDGVALEYSRGLYRADLMKYLWQPTTKRHI